MTVHLCKSIILGAVVVLLGSCASGSQQTKTGRANVDAMLTRIHQAAARDQSAIKVVPLRAPGVMVLQQQADSATIKGDLDTASDKLQQALRLEPGSPPLLQAQAELALRQHRWKQAERKALDSWKRGPKVGPLCASNWQTVIEVRTLEDDATGAETASKWLKRCHAEGVHRY